jgi:hypothetical protein
LVRPASRLGSVAAGETHRPAPSGQEGPKRDDAEDQQQQSDADRGSNLWRHGRPPGI